MVVFSPIFYLKLLHILGCWGFIFNCVYLLFLSTPLNPVCAKQSGRREGVRGSKWASGHPIEPTSECLPTAAWALGKGLGPWGGHHWARPSPAPWLHVWVPETQDEGRGHLVPTQRGHLDTNCRTRQGAGWHLSLSRSHGAVASPSLRWELWVTSC